MQISGRLEFPLTVPLVAFSLGGPFDSFNQDAAEAIAAFQIRIHDLEPNFVDSGATQKDLSPHVAHSDRDIEIGF